MLKIFWTLSLWGILIDVILTIIYKFNSDNEALSKTLVLTHGITGFSILLTVLAYGYEQLLKF